MLDNLKIALNRQRRLITIFLLTIFVPSVALGIFGIRAIKSERFRQAKQLEDEHRRTARFITSRLAATIGDVEGDLKSLVEALPFGNRDTGRIAELMRERLGPHPLVESAFLVHGEEEPFFPLFQPAPVEAREGPRSELSGSLQRKLDDAEENEFVRNNPGRAAVLYSELAGQAKDQTVKARMISSEARCLAKLGRFGESIRRYERVEAEYPLALSESGTPLALLGRLQAVACYRSMDDPRKAMETSLLALEDILRMRWALNESQFKAYSALTTEAAEEILAEIPESTGGTVFRVRLDRLKGSLQEKLEEWKSINILREDLIPGLKRRMTGSSRPEEAVRYGGVLGDRTFLVLAKSVPAVEDRAGPSFAGIVLRLEGLLDEIRSLAGQEVDGTAGPRLLVSDLEGRVLLGTENPEGSRDAVTEFFEDNFPPWKIELVRGPGEGLGIAGLERSFYFWTIVTLVVVLTFGTVLVVRTIGQEMDVLRLKSDFVASVSHEFKTPLTSMRALLERLQGGKVKDARKMDEYFSLLSRNTDQLNRLVKNLLDFSKIEEGKKEYQFIPTDIAELVSDQIREFSMDVQDAGIEFRVEADPDIPQISVDRDAVSQAVVNLLDNAVKFSPGKTPVEVRVGKAGEQAFIEVADQGIGIPQNELEKIFDKFYQGKGVIRQSARGTGLGLTLVKHTVEAHGGTVAVSSRPGTGSTFRLIFPIRNK